MKICKRDVLRLWKVYGLWTPHGSYQTAKAWKVYTKACNNLYKYVTSYCQHYISLHYLHYITSLGTFWFRSFFVVLCLRIHSLYYTILCLLLLTGKMSYYETWGVSMAWWERWICSTFWYHDIHFIYTLPILSYIISWLYFINIDILY